MLGHILTRRRQKMIRSDRHFTLTKDTVLNGARVLVQSPKRAFQYAVAWMRVVQSVP